MVISLGRYVNPHKNEVSARRLDYADPQTPIKSEIGKEEVDQQCQISTILGDDGMQQVSSLACSYLTSL
jgi:hypothetical protein